MIRLMGRTVALIALAAIPTAALAQKEPPATRETREAEKFLGLAMMRQTAQDKRPQFEEAMRHLQTGMTKNPDNARIWLLAGQVYVGLGDFIGADSAFARAEKLHPPYAEEISGEREVAWMEAFNSGIGLMDEQKIDEAIKQMELAELLYPLRPEAKMNLGALYASRSESDKAIAIFEKAIESTNGPLREKLKPEDAANWNRYAEMARLNIAQIIGSQGVEHFEAKNHDAAIAAFAKAAEINPYSRDYLFNLAQSYYAKSSAIEEQRNAVLAEQDELTKAKKTAEAKAKSDEAAQLGTQLMPLFEQIVKISERTIQLDPANESLYHLVARSHRVSADVSSTDAERTAWQTKALDALKLRDELQFEVSEVIITPADGEATIRGSIRNLKATAGSPIKLRLTLVGMNGSSIGTQEFTVTAPAVDESATFEGKTAITGDVAGWKYEVLK